jgi:oligopeptidase B
MPIRSIRDAPAPRGAPPAPRLGCYPVDPTVELPNAQEAERMRRVTLLFLVGLACLATACGSPPGPSPSAIPAPPVAEIVPTRLEKHGAVRTDDYYWLKDRDDPDVIRYLEAENEYTDAIMKHTDAFRKALLDEIVGRIKKNDESVPYKDGDYYYYERFREGGEYPIYCRKKGSLDGPEEILLDVNALAEGHDYYAVSGAKVSSGQDILGYATDTVGRRIYTLRFKNLATGETLPDEIPSVTNNFAWAQDGKTVFYTKQDPTTLRWFQTYRHVLGTDPADDVLVYEEEDDTFGTAVFKTKSKKFIMIASDQTLSSEYRFLEADAPMGKFRVFQPRERNHEYSVDHLGDRFYIRTNMDAKNFRLMATPVASTESRNWTDVIPHRDDVFLENFELFRDYLVVEERKDGLIQMRIRPWSGGAEHYLDFGEPAYLASIDVNAELDTPVLRYAYTSLTTPRTIYDYDMATRQKKLLKQDEILGGFDSANYTTERLWATARDGVKVPISLVYRNGFRRDGSSPLLLYGYGSYGSSLDASFRSDRLSLLDRGFVYAIAHIRGGEELGRQWYEHGKLLEKKNTFTDFIDAAQFLVEQKYADPQQVFAIGGSAGGLLMGAVVNMRPELWKGVVAAVPFVDVVTTMLDDTIPLTSSEYDEWGNPNDKEYYDYMLSYSPYDNVEAKDYPNLLVTAGLHDSQVQYWEPAKWVAKMRATKTGDHLLLLETNMEAGHSGTTGRFKRYEETALEYAFILDLAGIRG